MYNAHEIEEVVNRLDVCERTIKEIRIALEDAVGICKMKDIPDGVITQEFISNVYKLKDLGTRYSDAILNVNVEETIKEKYRNIKGGI